MRARKPKFFNDGCAEHAQFPSRASSPPTEAPFDPIEEIAFFNDMCNAYKPAAPATDGQQPAANNNRLPTVAEMTRWVGLYNKMRRARLAHQAAELERIANIYEQHNMHLIRERITSAATTPRTPNFSPRIQAGPSSPRGDNDDIYVERTRRHSYERKRLSMRNQSTMPLLACGNTVHRDGLLRSTRLDSDHFVYVWAKTTRQADFDGAGLFASRWEEDRHGDNRHACRHGIEKYDYNDSMVSKKSPSNLRVLFASGVPIFASSTSRFDLVASTTSDHRGI
ncbi:hypothetical protein SLS54_008808 [Diplodia seriata]